MSVRTILSILSAGGLCALAAVHFGWLATVIGLPLSFLLGVLLAMWDRHDADRRWQHETDEMFRQALRRWDP